MDPGNLLINPGGGGGGDDTETPGSHEEISGCILVYLLCSAVTFFAIAAVAICFHPGLRAHPAWGSVVIAIGVLDLAAACFWWGVLTFFNFCGT